jgi:DNA repair exonuclease SbcCD nuclease subunit
VDGVLIAGDLFDSRRLSFSTERFLMDELARLHEASIQTICVTGNHDAAAQGTALDRIEWPPSFLMMTDSKPFTHTIHGKTGKPLAHVTGAGYGNGLVRDNLALSFPAARGIGVPEIGLLHTWVTSARSLEQHPRYAPCTVEDLRSKRYTYWALGHVHLSQCVDEECSAWYSGVLQGRTPKESGVKGGLLVGIDDMGRVEVELRPFATARWEEISLRHLEAVSSLGGLREAASSAVTKMRAQDSHTRDWFLSLKLEGPCPLADALREEIEREAIEEDLLNLTGVSHLELDTASLVRPIDIPAYRGEPHVLAEVLHLIELAEQNANVLESLTPATLAGLPSSGDRLAYLRGLLKGLDREAASLFVEPERVH